MSDKYDLVAEAEKVIQAEFEHGIHARSTTASWDCEPSVSATRSSAYYLDVTHPKANKGAVVEEQQLDLFADRTSTHWMATNPLRLWFDQRLRANAFNWKTLYSHVINRFCRGEPESGYLTCV